MMMHYKKKSTAVFWDTDTSCYFPEEYDPHQVRQSIETAFKDYLPLTISAIGNLKRIPHPLWEPILSTGIFMKHSPYAHISIMTDMDRWIKNNPAPATIILISDREELFEVSGVLPSLRGSGYTIETKPWKHIFSAGCNETTSKKVKHKCSEIAWVCQKCIDSGRTFAGESYESLTRHFKSVEHIYQENKGLPGNILHKYFIGERDYSSKRTGVWWDINTCLVPKGFDPCQVRQCIDSALKNHLPFTISAIGNLERIPPGVLEPILSTGIFMRHGLDGPVEILKDMDLWALDHPPPATIILISDHEQVFLTKKFLLKLSDRGYTIIRAFPNHPKVSPKYPAQTWLWEYLLSGDSAGSKDTIQEMTRTEISSQVSSSLTKKTGVWWDPNTCHVPRGYHLRQVRRSIESAFSNYLPFTITAIGNLERIPPRVLKQIHSSGFCTKPLDDGPVDILRDMYSWARKNPPPATLILISDRKKFLVESKILVSFKERGYTIISAFQEYPQVPPKYASQTILWDYLLSAGYEDTKQETTSTEIMDKCCETAWVCNICIASGRNFGGESYKSLKRHFKSVEHKIQDEEKVSTNVKNQSMASGNTLNLNLFMA